MQVCKGIKFLLSAAACSALFVSFVSAQSSGITSPQMPVIVSPTLGSGFYMPGNDSNSPYTGYVSENKSTEKSTEKNETEESKSEEPKKTLTASDIANLNSLGLLNQLESLSGKKNVLQDLSLETGSKDQTNLILNRILSELEDIKEKNSDIELPEPALTVSYKNADNIVSNHIQPKLLKFSVNNYDILKTCRTIYISNEQKDGTFLVTGDRKYMSDGNPRTETFHLLFKAGSSTEGPSTYKTAAAVSQDYLNKYSFLYQLSQKQDLCAKRTGNLVSMRTDDPTWQLELLIDLGE